MRWASRSGMHEPGLDELATTIRARLDERRLGIIVEEGAQLTEEQWQELRTAEGWMK